MRIRPAARLVLTALSCLAPSACVGTGADSGAASQFSTPGTGGVADLEVIINDGFALRYATPVPTSYLYWVVVRNHGPDDARARTTVELPPDGIAHAWTCVSFGASTCGAPSGTGLVGDTAFVPAGGEIQYRVEVGQSSSVPGPFAVTARVAPAGGESDPVDANNVSTDTDLLVIENDVRVELTDGRTDAVAGDTLRYTLTVTNHGPSNAAGVLVEDAFAPGVFDAVSWVCTPPAGGSCEAASGTGDISQRVAMTVGSAVVFTIDARLAAGFSGVARNTARATPLFPLHPEDDAATDETRVSARTAPPPDCAAARAVEPRVWPPNHRLVPVALTGVVGGEGAVQLRVTGVTQDEALDSAGDGATTPDAVLHADGTASVRAERDGRGDGRVYRVAFEATDAAGQSCRGEVSVCVPHAGGDATCVDSGLRVDSTGGP